MLRLVWTYYAPGEVARAVEHIDVLVGRGASPEAAAEDAAKIYRARTGDDRTPYLRAHLLTQWRVRSRRKPGPEFGPLSAHSPNTWRPQPSKYPTEVSFRAFFHRLFHE
jgi:hypothetical protein